MPFPKSPPKFGLLKKSRDGLFSCQVQSLFFSSKLKGTVIHKVDFPLSFITSGRQYKISRWWIQGHFEQFLNLYRNYCFPKYTLERSLHGKLCVISLGRKRKERRYFLSVLPIRHPRPYNKPVNTSLLWHKFLQVHHNFGLCHFLSIPSKIHLLVLVKSFQQPKFSQIIYLHSFTKLFHKISRCSSEQIAVIPESYL